MIGKKCNLRKIVLKILTIPKTEKCYINIKKKFGIPASDLTGKERNWLH